MLSQVRSSPFGEEWISHSLLYQPSDRRQKGNSADEMSAATSTSVRIVIVRNGYPLLSAVTATLVGLQGMWSIY